MRILAIALILTASAARAETTLCTPAENAIFSCQAGTKIISLCGSKDLSESAGTLFYRAGKPGALELSYPDAGADPRKAFTRAVIAPGNGDFVRFSRAGITYSVYSARNGSGKPFLDGILVTQGKKVLADLKCKGVGLGPNGWTAIYASGLPDDPANNLYPDD